MAKKLIITHPGDAHLDDTLSVAVALAVECENGYELPIVERREPTRKELDDPKVVVLDVGGDYDPAKSNYDHHQLPRDAEAECALSLYARDLVWKGESVFEAFGITKWFQVLKTADSKGPFQLAKDLDITPEVVFKLHSPLEESLVVEFQKNPRRELHRVLSWIGKRLLDDAVDALKRVKALDGLCHIVEVDGVSGYVLESDDTTGTETWRERSAPGTMFSIVHDNRGPGWTLYRYDDDPRLDFSRLQGREEITFAHKGGFIAKTAGRDVVSFEQALELVRAAIVHSEAQTPADQGPQPTE